MEIKVMSFNLRLDLESDGINSFTNRRNRVLDVIYNESPDVVGFQEVTDSMRAFLSSHLKGYTLIGCGRNEDYRGEGTCVAFKTSSFELVSSDNLWLSPTPRCPGTRYTDGHSSCPRMVTMLLLKHNDIDRPFRFINTHLDHWGAQGRFMEAIQISDLLCSTKEKFVLTGDFNAIPSAPEMLLISATVREKGGADFTRELPPTFHDFGRLEGEGRVKIDYIFSNAKYVNSYVAKNECIDGQYYSDHDAPVAIIEL